MSIRDKRYVTEMPDGSRWAVPVEVVALSRAKFYAEEFGENVALSLEEDTLPLFEENEREIADWAKSNMNWEDVVEHAVRLPDEDEPEVDYQEGWVNGDYEIRD